MVKQPTTPFIHVKHFSSLNLLDSEVYDICTTHPDCNYYESQLYKNYSNYIKEYLSERILPKITLKTDTMMLEETVKNWKNFKDIFIKFCVKIYQYLDRFYVHIENQRVLKEEGHFIFYETIFNKLKTQMRNVILTKIEQDRNGVQINRNLLSDSILIFLDMNSCGDETDNIYFEEFEKYIKEETSNYCKRF
jgi:hypothetical protein